MSFSLSQIHPRAFAHPDDVKATEALSKIPGLGTVMKKISELGMEEAIHYQNSLRSVRVGPSQYPSLWKMVCQAAHVLGLPSLDTYLTTNPSINAFAFGKKRYTITLTSALVDLMPDEEIKVIIAHEMGHIVCEHMLYKSIGVMLANQAIRHLLPSKLIAGSLEMALLSWSRAAEYSADRAALLVCQKPKTVVSALGRLAGGSSRFGHEYNPEALLVQLDELQVHGGWIGKITSFHQEVTSTHPEPVKRAAAIMSWAQSDQYKAIIQGRYLTKAEHEARQRIRIAGVDSCAHCRAPVGTNDRCPNCGLSQNPDEHTRCTSDHIIDTSWKFCRMCGNPPHGARLMGSDVAKLKVAQNDGHIN